MVFDHRGGEGVGSPKAKSLFRSVFMVLNWTFSVQILKILSKKTIVKVRLPKYKEKLKLQKANIDQLSNRF